MLHPTAHDRGPGLRAPARLQVLLPERSKRVLICIPGVLTKEQVSHCRKVMDKAEWVDGRVTAGAQSGSVKHNDQLPERSLAANQLGDLVIEALARCPLF